MQAGPVWRRPKQSKPRPTIGVAEVAEVLHGHDGHAAREAVRAGIDAGDILPGLVKSCGRWLVPLAALALWIDARIETPQEPRRRGRLPDSVRLSQKAERFAALRAQSAAFFQEVRGFMGAQAGAPLAPAADRAAVTRFSNRRARLKVPRFRANR